MRVGLKQIKMFSRLHYPSKRDSTINMFGQNMALHI